MQVDRCPICLSEETETDPFVPMCSRTDDVKHFAHKTCLRSVFESGIKHCVYQDKNAIPLRSIFSDREIIQMQSQSIVKYAREEIIDPICAFLGPTKAYTTAAKERMTATKNVFKWLEKPNPETRDQFFQNLVLIATTTALIEKHHKGMRLAAKTALVTIGTLGSLALCLVGRAVYNAKHY